ncbi:MAG: LemA family protein [Cytophagales bacterium]|nr:LemA family protein [Cytophagales bacterium]
MDVQLKKRYDLIPNLVETVKQYAGHEKELLENVTKLRAKVTDGQLSSDEKVALDNQISKSIGGIMVAVENYPDLKASENFINLQRTLNEVESQISASRRAFNASVTDYNNAIETFPKNILAGMMNYKRKQVFEIQEVERQNVNVSKLF